MMQCQPLVIRNDKEFMPLFITLIIIAMKGAINSFVYERSINLLLCEEKISSPPLENTINCPPCDESN